MRDGDGRAEVGVRECGVDPEALDVERVRFRAERTEARRCREADVVSGILHRNEDVFVLSELQAHRIRDRANGGVEPFFEDLLRAYELRFQLVGWKRREHAMGRRM